MAALLPVMAVAMAPDASWAVTVAQDGTVRTWVNGVAASESRGVVRIDADGPMAAALSMNMFRVLGVAERMLRLYEYAPGAAPRHRELPAPIPVQALALSPSGRTAVVAGDDRMLRGIDLGTGQVDWMLAVGASPVRAVAVASEGGPVVAVFADGKVRRYDRTRGTSEILGIGPPAQFVAITPDGQIVVTAIGDGVLARWDSGARASPKTYTLHMGITAIAINGTGDQVLIGAANGTVRLQDLAGGPCVEYLVPAAPGLAEATAAAPAAAAPGESATGSFPVGAYHEPAVAPAGTVTQPLSPYARSVVDDDVRFTVYRPQTLSPGRWALLLVFAHKTTPVAEHGREPVDPLEMVEARARAHFGGEVPDPVGEDARHGLALGVQLRIVPDLPGIRCNPEDAEVQWWEPVHEVMFRLLAGRELAGTVVRGAVRVWCGPLIIGEVSIAVRIAADGPAARPPPVIHPVVRYRKIFASYSHRDRAVVASFAEAARAMGDQYLQDVLALRAGEPWGARLLELMADADVFQLFWSRNSMRSPRCREEWEHALALRRPLFVRPLYWEEPLPQDPGQELPPVALRALHFVKVPVIELKPVEPMPAATGWPGPGGLSGYQPGAPWQPSPPPGYGAGQPSAGKNRWRWAPVVLAALILLLLVVAVALQLTGR